MIRCRNGHLNPDGATYCSVCHTYIDAAGEHVEPAPAPPPQPPPEQPPPEQPPPEAESWPTPPPRPRPLVSLAQTALTTSAGTEVTGHLRVRNPGTGPDDYVVAIGGAAAAWGVVEPSTLSLAAGEAAVARLAFLPPPGTSPGTAAFEVAVTSRQLPDIPVVVQGVVRVTAPAPVEAPPPADEPEEPRQAGRVRTFATDVSIEAVGGAVTSLAVGWLGAIPALLGLVAGAVISVNVERLLVPVFRPSARPRRPRAADASVPPTGRSRLRWYLPATVIAVAAVIVAFTAIDLVRGESLVGDRKTTFFPRSQPPPTTTTADGSPTIVGFTPESGAIGTAVTISGTNFTSPAKVEFGEASAEASSVSDTELTVTVPEGATSGPLVVHLAGADVTSDGTFTVTPPPPSIEDITPSSGSVGDVVTITGTNFTPPAEVDFNGASVEASVDSDTQLTATVPEGATSGPVHVAVAGGTATSPNDFVIGP